MQHTINQKDVKNKNLPIKVNQGYSNLPKPLSQGQGTTANLLCPSPSCLGVFALLITPNQKANRCKPKKEITP
jgi:hypothetical protein